MNYKPNLLELEIFEKKIKSEISSLSGQSKLLNEQILSSEKKIKDCNHKKKIYKKSIEFLILIQQTSKNKIKKGFENIVTYALRYIYSSDYKFELEFGRRGNLQELDFNVKTPKCKTAFDPKETSGGGVLDILSIALRIALLELIKPKIKGFLMFDEPFKHLSAEYLERAYNFIEIINKKIKRQIIMITHKSEFISNSENVIKIGGKDNDKITKS